MISHHLNAGLSAARQRRASLSHLSMLQVRHFKSKDHAASSWFSRHDPSFQQYQKRRNMVTRAQQLKRMRRHHQWDWSGSDAAFFTPRHIRLASHYYGSRNRGAGRWQKQPESDEEKSIRTEEWNESDEYELSSREKSWKEHMERLRKRIEADPYEAVFGRRFEPFWGSLLPKWLSLEDVVPQPEPTPKHKVAPAKQSPKSDAGATNTSPTSFAYSSSTSWDSVSNKTHKTEWDSVSQETKHYEYDPISNRMVSVSSKAAPAQVLLRETSKRAKQAEPASTRKAIPVPSHTLTSTTATEQTEVNSLTAGSIRASMGKGRSQTDAEVSILLGEDVGKTKRPSASSHWDHAEQFLMLEQEVDGLRKQKEHILRSERRAFHFADLARKLEVIQNKLNVAEKKIDAMNTERIAMSENTITATRMPLRPAVDRLQSKPAQQILEHDDSAAHESTEDRPVVPRSWTEQADLLQAERVRRVNNKTPQLETADKEAEKRTHDRAIKSSKANEMLQAEIDRHKLVMKLHEERHKDDIRVLHGELVAAIQSKADDEPRNSLERLQNKVMSLEASEKKYKAKISSLKAELNIAYTQSSRHADEFRNQIKQSEARNHTLAATEEKYKRKVASLREDLDTAFKQSSRHAAEFRDQISRAASDAAGQASSTVRLARATEKKYKAQILALKEELTLAYEQSSRHSDEFRRTINLLEKRIEQDAPKLQSTTMAGRPSQMTSQASEAALRKQHDKALVREVRNIYESAYGAIGTEKQNAAPAVNLDAALDQYENKSCYTFKGDDLESELSGKPSMKQARSKPTEEVKPYVAPEPAPVYQSDSYESKSESSKEKINAYDFKYDDLETELTADGLLHDCGTGVYRFKPDHLKQELTMTSDEYASHSPSDKGYTFRDDSLEKELKVQEEPAEDNADESYRFKHDDLEAELRSREASAASSDPAELDPKSYAFKPDTLEAELVKQTPSAAETRQNRASLRERISQDFKDFHKMLYEVKSGKAVPPRRHPIDGMTSPAVSNYASPTGFVNLDPVSSDQGSKRSKPKVHREEAVFSGQQRVKHSKNTPLEAYRLSQYRRRRRRTRRLFKYGSIAAVATAVVVYTEGSVMETRQSIKEQSQREAWHAIVREYERSGERGIAKAMDGTKIADMEKNHSGFFWK